LPVRNAGRGTQRIADVALCNDTDRRARHVRSVRELYAHAPHLQPHLAALEELDVVFKGWR
jgi:hypothetical protein